MPVGIVRRKVIRGGGAAYIFTVAICAIVMVLFLADALIRAPTRAMLAIWLGCAVAFALLLWGALTTRVIIDGNEISYRGWLPFTRSLTLDRIKQAEVIVRPGYRFDVHYLVLESIEEGVPPLKIRTDLFPHPDVQYIRSFLGGKLKKR